MVTATKTAFIGNTADSPEPAGTGGKTAPGSPEPQNDPDGPLYADHIKVYPRSIKGTFRKLKTVAAWLMLGVYFVGPWFRWERPGDAPDQAILMDMDGRRGYILGLEIWPQEVYYLTGLLTIAAIGLFFITALAGRVWCGFACPQTVFTDLFVWFEKLFEGDRNRRLKLDKGPLTVGKVFKKLGKHTVWMAISYWTAVTFCIYFLEAHTYTPQILKFEASGWTMSMVGLVAVSTYVLGGWAREQVCIYMCPWPRFQGAMFDEDSLIVTYEEWRGEPRAKARPGGSFEDRGHCVDCTMCVQVCPTGIDIREGQQMACIGCALCVDACNQVMDRFKLPRGLITYDSIHNQLAREGGRPTKLALFRPRTWVYVGVMSLVALVMAIGLLNRATLEVNVIRDRSPLFVQLSDGRVRNGYTFKVLNMQSEAQAYTLTTVGVDGAVMTVIGQDKGDVAGTEIDVKADAVGAFRILVKAGKKALDGKSTGMAFVLTNKATGEVVEHDTVFAGPAR